MQQMLLWNATVILLQNVTKVYCKLRPAFYYKNATVLLQNMTVITKCDDFVKKYNVCIKMHQYIGIQ